VVEVGVHVFVGDGPDIEGAAGVGEEPAERPRRAPVDAAEGSKGSRLPHPKADLL
jgi:hypothetical protein